MAGTPQTFAVKRLSKEFYARKQMTDKAPAVWTVLTQNVWKKYGKLIMNKLRPEAKEELKNDV